MTAARVEDGAGTGGSAVLGASTEGGGGGGEEATLKSRNPCTSTRKIAEPTTHVTIVEQREQVSELLLRLWKLLPVERHLSRRCTAPGRCPGAAACERR